MRGRPRATSAHIAAAALLLAAAPASGHDPGAEAPNDHGKLATSDATPVGAGTLEVSLAWQPSWNRTGHGDFERTSPRLTQPLVLGLVRGLTDDLDVGASLAWTSAREVGPAAAPPGGAAAPARGEGLSDVVVAARYRFLCTRELDLAVVGGAVLPTGLRATSGHLGFTQGFWSGQVALVASLDEGPFTGNLEGGLSAPLPGSATVDVASVFANAAAGVQLGGWLQPTLEVSWLRAFEASGPDVELVTLTAGLLLPLPDGFGVTAGVQHAVWGRHTPDFTSGTFSVRRSF